MNRFWTLMLLLALFLVACGGNSSNEAVADPTPTAGALRPATEEQVEEQNPVETANEETATAEPQPEEETTAVPVVEGTATPAPAVNTPLPATGYPVGDVGEANEVAPPEPASELVTGYPASETDERADEEDGEESITAVGNATTSASTPVPPPTATIDPNQVFATIGPTETTAEEVLRTIFVDVQTNVGAEASEIEIEEIVAGSWSSTALGCPDPTETYSDEVTPGYMVTLVIGYDVYVYHTDDALNVLLCEAVEQEEITPLPSVNQ